MTASYIQGERDSAFLRKSIFLSAIIIISNYFIGIVAPTLAGLDDEIQFLDSLWRVVVGQRVGVDYHNPLGFGPYELGALLWHWLGPHYYVMRLAITLFSLSIAFCGCVVAKQTLTRRTDLALLFCVTLAFQLSAPTIYESARTSLSMSGYYDRQIVSALAVLFVQTLSGSSRLATRENGVQIALTAFLLNLLFLIKISGFLLGLMIVLAGCLLRGRIVHQLLNLCAALVAFAAITAIEFRVTGIEFIPVIQDYELAAHARLTYSFYEIVRGMVSWPLAGSVALLMLFAVSKRPEESRVNFRRIGLIIGSYAACQYALNMTNGWNSSMWLAPAAVATLAGCMGEKPVAQWWRRFAPSRLTEISVREAIPYLIFVLVLVPEVVASLAGTTVGALVSLGFEGPPIVVTAGNGVSFRSLALRAGHDSPVYAKSLNNAVTAIASLNLGHEAIANLDFSNPFPVLFLAPPPRGAYAVFDLFFSRMRDWQEVIGDACVVTIPARPDIPEITVRLNDIMQSKLQADFEMVFQSEYWEIYRRTRDCATAPSL